MAASELVLRGEPEAIALLSWMCRTGSIEQLDRAVAAHRGTDILSNGLVAALGDENISVRLAAADLLMD